LDSEIETPAINWKYLLSITSPNNWKKLRKKEREHLNELNGYIKVTRKNS
jgi:hypothetical protein